VLEHHFDDRQLAVDVLQVRVRQVVRICTNRIRSTSARL
jgi:hypothetical protein